MLWICGAVLFNEIRTILDELDNQEDLDFKVLFLDATDSELVARYKETRRSHPLAADGRVLDGITLERELLSPLKISVKMWWIRLS